jgi:hypothetical protein
MQAVFTTRLGKWNACFWPQIKVVAPELLLTAVVGAMIPKRRGWLYPQAAPMIKSLAAVAIFAVLGGSVIALPGFAPKVEAGQAVVLAKADRLEVQPFAPNCFRQVWPNFVTACLRNRNSEALFEARLVTARR